MTAAPTSPEAVETARTPAGVGFNPFSAAFNADPYPFYHAQRTRAPVASVPGFRGNDWILTRYREIARVLGDPQFRADPIPEQIERTAANAGTPDDVGALCAATRHWLFFLDGNRHRALRGLINRRFGPAQVRRLRVEYHRLAGRLLDSVEARVPFDLMAALARPLPLLSGGLLMGMRIDDVGLMGRLANDLFAIFRLPTALSGYCRLNASAATLRQILADVMEAKRRDPGDDMATDLVQLVEAGRIEREAALSLAMMVFSVGQDTTENLIGNAVLALVQHPEVLQRLHREPELLADALRELARYDTPVQLVLRVAERDVELAGQTVRAGERMHLFLGAANRDPDVFAEPDRPWIGRREISHLIFGGGQHFCLGSHLALLQGEAAIGALVSRFPHLHLDGAGVARFRSVHMRGLSRLPLVAA